MRARPQLPRNGKLRPRCTLRLGAARCGNEPLHVAGPKKALSTSRRLFAMRGPRCGNTLRGPRCGDTSRRVTLHVARCGAAKGMPGPAGGMPNASRRRTAFAKTKCRHRSARRGRARLRALFCAVRGLPAPVAVSSTARHALPDPSYHPVRAADSQHTLECMARPAEQRSRSAVCRVSRRRGASRAVAAQVAPSRRKLQ